jgi:hypothetical protein
MKRYIPYSLVFIIFAAIFWAMAGQHLSYGVEAPSGRLLYSVGYPIGFELVISALVSFIFTLVIFFMRKMPKILANIATIIFIFFVASCVLIIWLVAERPDFKSVDDVTMPIEDMKDPDQAELPGEVSTKGGVETKGTPLSGEIKSYVSKDLSISFEYPSNLAVLPVSKVTRNTLIGPVEMEYPRDSFNIPGLFIVSKVPYTDLVYDKAIVDWHSCCSGIRYWYDKDKNTWESEAFKSSAFDASGIAKNEEKKTHLLTKAGACKLKETFGTNTFYKIVSTEEGGPYRYVLLYDDKPGLCDQIFCCKRYQRRLF